MSATAQRPPAPTPPGPTPKKKRGRPRMASTLVVSVRIPTQIYDAYCLRALRSDQDVRTVLRRVLTRNVRTEDLL